MSSVPPGAVARPSDAGDVRVAAVLDVLAGRAAAEVALAHGVEPALLERWVDAFVDAGAARLGNRAPADSYADRDRYLAVVAHELRTPLSTVRTWVSLMANDQFPAGQRVMALDAMTATLDRLERLVNDLLDTSAVALGRLRLSLAPVDLGLICRVVIASFGDHRLHLTTVPDLHVVADEGRLAQIVTNLVANARNHGAGGDISIDVADVDERWVEITVTNHGPPIPFEVVQRLFEPFQKGGESSGTGLGLYVVRALVAAHQGQIGVRSDDVSTTFWVKLLRDGPVGPA